MPRLAKVTSRDDRLTVRLSHNARKALLEITGRTKESQGAVIERLLNYEREDPNAYYLRMAAIHAFTSATVSRMVLGVVVENDEHPRELLRAAIERIEKEAVGLFGPLPPPPLEVREAMKKTDARIKVVLDNYGLLDPTE